MASYLERLVARAGIANDAPTAGPVPRSNYERQAGDPFENIALWEANPATPSAAPVAAVPRPPVPPTAIEIQPGPTVVVDSRTTELHVEEHWLQPAPPQPTVRAAAPEPVANLREEIVHEIELQPQPQMFEREIRTESTRVEASLERETVRTETLRPARRPDEPTALNPGDIERSVLEKLMPALDAWFASGATPPTAETSPQTPLAPSRQRDSETASSAATEAPQLVIGSIRVEVTSPPAPMTAGIPPRRAARVSPRVSRQSPSRLGFGLGQM
jgi:hypothetical protein